MCLDTRLFMLRLSRRQRRRYTQFHEAHSAGGVHTGHEGGAREGESASYLFLLFTGACPPPTVG